MEDFYRIRRLPPYVFEQSPGQGGRAERRGRYQSTSAWAIRICRRHPHVIEKLKDTLGKPRTDRYSASRASPGCARRRPPITLAGSGVKLNPETQVVATLGSKEGFANVRRRSPRPATSLLCPNPSYPIHAFGFLMAGGVIRWCRRSRRRNSSKRWSAPSSISIRSRSRLIVCYPSNPTAYVADLDFYKDLVAFAKKHEIFILSIWPTREVYFDDTEPPAVGAAGPRAPIDVTVEFTSMSKTFRWPAGDGLCGRNDRIIAALARVNPISITARVHAGSRSPPPAALNGPDDCIREIARHLSQAPRRAGGKFWPCGGPFRRRRLDVRLGAAAEGV